MTASDAMSQSASGAIRAMVEGGLVAISQSPDGFQLSFVPRTDKSEWNVPGSVIRGSFSTLEQAEHAANTVDWEPAPENLIGSEPSEDAVPGVEGHHILAHDHSGHRHR